MRRKKTKKSEKSKKFRVSTIKPGASIDTQITHAGLLMGYAFKHGIDLQRRCISLTGEINDSMFDKLDRALTEMEGESSKPITLKINSPGGYVYQAFAMVGRILESRCKIVTKGYGEVMSAATLVLASGTNRKISRHSIFMHHEFSYETPFSKHSTHKDVVEQAEREVEQWSRLMAKFTKKSAAFWTKIGTRKDSYLTAEQLLQFGVVDELF